jgi:ribose transport system ATP-binding protein
MLSEDRKLEGLALTMTIADNMTLTKLSPIISNSKQADAANEWIKKTGVKCRTPNQAVGELSGGNQQKVAIARLLYHGVDVLLLDEPTRGIDVGSKETIYTLIDQLALQGKAVLMISSYLPELLGTCDRIAVMHKGVLGKTVPVAETDAEAIIREAAGA